MRRLPVTTATGGVSSSKLSILAWTAGYPFVGDLTTHVLVGTGILWVLCREDTLPGSVDLGDIEVAHAAARTEIIAVKLRRSLPLWVREDDPGLNGFDDGASIPLLEAAERDNIGGKEEYMAVGADVAWCEGEECQVSR